MTAYTALDGYYTMDNLFEPLAQKFKLFGEPGRCNGCHGCHSSSGSQVVHAPGSPPLPIVTDCYAPGSPPLPIVTDCYAPGSPRYRLLRIVANCCAALTLTPLIRPGPLHDYERSIFSGVNIDAEGEIVCNMLELWAIDNINDQFKRGAFSPPIHAQMNKEVFEIGDAIKTIFAANFQARCSRGRGRGRGRGAGEGRGRCSTSKVPGWQQWWAAGALLPMSRWPRRHLSGGATSGGQPWRAHVDHARR